MRDKPDATAILGEVQDALKAGIAPGFQQVVAANAVALALREQALAGDAERAERARLADLIGDGGDIATDNRALAEAIRDGKIDMARADLRAHLIRTTIEKMQIDQPRYPAFRKWSEGESQ